MGGGGFVENLPAMHAAGLLNEKLSFNHCFGTAERDFELIGRAGAQINLCPRSDATFGLGPSHPPVLEALAAGVAPGLSMDNEIIARNCTARGLRCELPRNPVRCEGIAPEPLG